MAADLRLAYRRQRGRIQICVGGIAVAIALLSVLILFGADAVAQSTSRAARQADRHMQDAQLKRRIAGRMLDARAVFFSDIDVDAVAGDILLTGRVKTRQDKIRAAALVRSVLGVETVVNEIRVRKNSHIDTISNDLDINKRIGQALRTVFRTRMPHMAWRANEGVVYVFGRAKSEWEHNRALAVIRKTPDIKDIVDHLRIVRN